MQLVHGGDWAGFEAEYGYPPLDFSANVSPLGVPAGVQQAIAQAAAGVDRYPDPLCRALTRAIAGQEWLPADWILCGNGAADLIWRLASALRPRRALLLAPTFAEYEEALRSVHCQISRYLLAEETDFAIQEDFVQAITPDTDLVFLCEPNNPTGRTTPMTLLEKILERCDAVGAVLVVDECFGDFLDDPAQHTLRPQIAQHPRLLLLKAFTKLYAMAGVRLGYALCSDPDLLDGMRSAGAPWTVSSLAQAAGMAALRETEYVRQVQALIRKERPLLVQGLRRLGLRVVPGQANYLLFQSKLPLTEPMRQRGILLRNCGNYPGLDSTWYRTAVRTEVENRRLLAVLAEVLS